MMVAELDAPDGDVDREKTNAGQLTVRDAEIYDAETVRYF